MAGFESAVEGLSACECPVCFLFLSEQERLPMSMPCGHTLCKVCVDQLADQSTSTVGSLGQKSRPTFPCPLCRQWINVDSISLNVTLRDLLYELKRLEVKHTVPVGMSLNVNYSDIAFGNPLDRGAFGEVYRARWRGDDVAVKVFASGQLTPEAMQAFQREVFVMNCLRHPNIVLLMGACQTPPRLAIVMEFVAGGSLHKVLHIDKVKLAPAHIGQLGVDVCRGLQYLHSINILHRDMKSKNVLLTGDLPCQAKLCDFGLARMRQESATMTGNIGTVHWTAPEVLNNSRYQFSADIYSFGMVLYEMVMGHIPFPTMIPMAVMVAVVVNKQQPSIPNDAHPTLTTLIRRCIQWNPEDRPSISDVLSTLVELLPSPQPSTTQEPTKRPPLNHQDSLGVVFVPVSDTGDLEQQDSQLHRMWKALQDISSPPPGLTSPSSPPPGLTSPSSPPPGLTSSSSPPQDKWDYDQPHHGDISDYELALQLDVEAKSHQYESDFKLAEQLQMRENTFLAPKDEVSSRHVTPPQPLLESIKSGNVPQLKQVPKKKSPLPTKKSKSPSKMSPPPVTANVAVSPVQAKSSSLAKSQIPPTKSGPQSRVSFPSKSAPLASNKTAMKSSVRSEGYKKTLFGKKKTATKTQGPPIPPAPPLPPEPRPGRWHTARQVLLAQVRQRAPTVAKQLKPVQTVEKRAFRIGRVVDGYDPERAQYTLQNQVATFNKTRLRHVDLMEPPPEYPVGRVVSTPKGKVKRVSSMIDQKAVIPPPPPPPPPPRPRMRLHPSIKSAVEHFRVSELHHVTTEVKNILPNTEIIEMERSLHPVIRTEIEEFQKSDLQQVETVVKNQLPTAEAIALEKQQRQKQKQKQQRQQKRQKQTQEDDFGDAKTSSSEGDELGKRLYQHPHVASNRRDSASLDGPRNDVPEGGYRRSSSMGVEQDIGQTLRADHYSCTVS